MRRLFVIAGVLVCLLIAGGAALLFVPEVTEKQVELTCSMTAPSEGCQSRMTAMGHVWSIKGRLDRAAIWYQRAAEAGDPVAMFHLAWIYDTNGASLAGGLVRQFEALDMDVPQADRARERETAARRHENFQRAAEWYRKSADKGFTPAMNNLAQLYLLGQFGAPNYAEALRLHLRAAQAGNPVAAMNVSLAFRTGQGVAVDRAQAQKWAIFVPPADAPEIGSLAMKRTKLYGSDLGSREAAVLRGALKEKAPVTANFQPLKPDSRIPTFSQVQRELRQ